jgi:2-polyprenyl-6-methoxyphenol hydroxylase-like FAD-dependent oxidoreductase
MQRRTNYRITLSQEIVKALHGSDLYCYQGRVSTPPAKNWRQKLQDPSQIEKGHSRVLLMGDAMHAMNPSR